MSSPRCHPIVLGLLGLISVLASVSSGCSGSSDTDAAPTTAGEGAATSVAWEAVVQAASAEVLAPPAGTDPGDRLVQLSDIDDAVVIFSDRPTRREGEMRVEEFVALWHSGAFGTDPPNAAVLIDGQVLAAELTGAALDMAAGTLALTTGALDGGGAGLPVGRHDGVTLFVDSFPTGPSSPITDSVTQANVKVLGEAPAESMGDLYAKVGASLPTEPTVPPEDAYLQQAEQDLLSIPASDDTAWWSSVVTPAQGSVLGLNTPG